MTMSGTGSSLGKVGSKGEKQRLWQSKRHRRGGKKGRKYGRKHRNGKPHGVHGGCGCDFCRHRAWS